jgi:hypothetical protein
MYFITPWYKPCSEYQINGQALLRLRFDSIYDDLQSCIIHGHFIPGSNDVQTLIIQLILGAAVQGVEQHTTMTGRDNDEDPFPKIDYDKEHYEQDDDDVQSILIEP